MLEYVVGGVILVGGSFFAAFNGLMSARDDVQRERDERRWASERASERARADQAKEAA
jgi:hypothetical protein